jgi:hypothetical protein
MASTTAPSGFSPRVASPGTGAEKIRRCGPAPRRCVGVKSARVQGGRGRLAHPGRHLARAGRRHHLAGGVDDGDGEIAVGRRHALELPGHPAVALAGQHRANGRRARQHFRVGAPRVQPARYEARTVVGERGQPRVPVLDGDPALVGDVVPREAHHRDDAHEEDHQVHPGQHVSAGLADTLVAEDVGHAAHCAPRGPPVSRRARKPSRQRAR